MGEDYSILERVRDAKSRWNLEELQELADEVEDINT